MPEPVHLCDWGSQPTIRIACDQSCDRAGWTQRGDLPEGVYNRDDGCLYTFTDELVTCEACRQR